MVSGLRRAAGSQIGSTPEQTIHFLANRVLHGCNHFHSTTVMKQSVDMGLLHDLPGVTAQSSFAQHYYERFGLLKLTDNDNGSGMDFQNMLRGTSELSMADLLLEAIVAVENAAREAMRVPEPVSFAKTISTDDPQRFDLVWDCITPQISRLSLQAARQGMLESLYDSYSVYRQPVGSDSFAAILKKLRKSARRRQLSVRSATLGAAAKRIGVPCEHIGSSYLRLGQGIAQKIIHESFCQPPAAVTPDPDQPKRPLLSVDEASERIRSLFPNGANGHIPTIVVVGEKGASKVARGLERLMLAVNRSVGLSVARGSRICGVPLEHETFRRRRAPEFLMQDARTEALICTKTSRSIVRAGLGLSSCDVVGILDPLPRLDPEIYQQSLQAMSKATKRTFVVGAKNDVALSRLRPTDAQQIMIVANDEDGAGLTAHLQAGGVAAFCLERDRNRYLEVRRGNAVVLTVPESFFLSSAQRSKSGRDLETNLFVLGLAYAAGLTQEEIESAILPQAAKIPSGE